MRTWITIILALGITTTAVFSAVMRNDRIPKAAPSNVAIEVQTGEVIYEDGSSAHTIAAGESLSSSTGKETVLTAMASNVEHAVSASEKAIETEAVPENRKRIVATEPSTLRLTLADALGDKIEQGTATLDGKPYDITNGELSIDNVPAGAHSLTVAAEGFADTTQTIQMPVSETVPVVMEYFCSFEVYVARQKWEKPKGGMTITSGGTFTSDDGKNHSISTMETQLTDDSNNKPVLVEDDPVENAEIYLWQGPRPLRPVKDKAVFCYENYKDDRFPVEVSRDNGLLRVISGGDGIRYTVTRSDDPNHMIRSRKNEDTKEGTITVPDDPDTYIYYPPAIGDTILGISGSMWNKSETSRILEIADIRYESQQPPIRPIQLWDTLSLLDSVPRGQGTGEFIEYNRQGVPGYHCIPGVRQTLKEEPIQKVKADSNGRFVFKNLPAGVYYVQAFDGLSRSPIEAIYPARGKQLLKIHDHSSLGIEVVDSKPETIKQPGFLDDKVESNPISNVTLQLKRIEPSEPSVRIIGNTDKNGFWRSRNFPFGTYELTIKPPSELGAPSKVMTLDVNEVSERLTVTVDVPRCTVSGRVLRKDTQEPVVGHPLRLERKKGLYSRTDNIAQALSGAGGIFEFREVYPGYRYEIRSDIEKDTYVGYLPAYDAIDMPDGHRTYDNPYFDITGENIGGIEYLVYPGAETRLTGKVMKWDGAPVPGIHVRVGRQGDFKIWEGFSATNENGEFDFTILSQDQSEEIETFIFAYKMGKNQGISFTHEDREIQLSSGLIPNEFYADSKIAFRPGQTIDGIELREIDLANAGVLTGKIRGEDGRWPISVALSTFDGLRNCIGTIDVDGNYRVEGIPPGPFDLHVSVVETRFTIAARNDYISHNGHDQNGQYRVGREYCNEKIHLVMPDPPESMQLDVSLKKSSSIVGIVVDSQGQPVNRATIKMSLITNDLYRFDYVTSNKEGFFKVTGMAEGESVTLEVLYGNNPEPVAVVKDLVAPIEDLKIEIKTEE